MSDNQAAQDPIRLDVGATADPNTCGSCQRFERTEPWNGTAGGYCLLRLPPQYARKPWGGESKPHDVVRDTDSCDLHVHTGKAYLVTKVVRP